MAQSRIVGGSTSVSDETDGPSVDTPTRDETGVSPLTPLIGSFLPSRSAAGVDTGGFDNPRTPTVPGPQTFSNTLGDDTFKIDGSNFDGSVIEAATGGSALENDVVEFGDRIIAAGLQFSRSGADLVLSASEGTVFGQPFSGPNGDTLVIKNFFLTNSAIDTFKFADGTTMSADDVWQQVIGADTVTDTLAQDGGGHTEVTLDGAQQQPWTSKVDEFDAAGNLVKTTFFMDDTTVQGTVVDGAGQVLNGTPGNDTLTGGDGNDHLDGSAGTDVLNGGAGDDALDGGPGADTMTGGTGNDAYYIDNLADNVVENPDEGADAVYVGVSGYVLADNVENGVVMLTTGLTLTGNALDNGLEGSIGKDELIGAGGNDRLDGNAGDDVLNGGDGNDQLYGRDGIDALDGGAGDDALDGGPGADIMTGGTGNDAYYIDDLGDKVIENAGEGADAVYVGVSGYVLADNVENGVVMVTTGVTLTGNALDNGLEGSTGDDVLTGGDGNDLFIFRSGYGDDTITDFHGGAGPSDQILLTGFDDVTDFAAVLSHATQDGADVVIDFGQGDHLVLKDVILAALAADDFRFS